MGHLSPSESQGLSKHGLFGITLFCDNSNCMKPIIREVHWVGKKNKVYCSLECKCSAEGRDLPKFRRRELKDWATASARRETKEKDLAFIRTKAKELVSVKKKVKWRMSRLIKTIHPLTALSSGQVVKVLRQLIAEKEFSKQGKRIVIGPKFKPLERAPQSVVEAPGNKGRGNNPPSGKQTPQRRSNEDNPGVKKASPFPKNVKWGKS